MVTLLHTINHVLFLIFIKFYKTFSNFLIYLKLMYLCMFSVSFFCLFKVIGVGFSTDRLDKIRERGAFQALTYKEKHLLKAIEEFGEERELKNIFDGEKGKCLKKILNG